jgi:hypothetical protein
MASSTAWVGHVRPSASGAASGTQAVKAFCSVPSVARALVGAEKTKYMTPEIFAAAAADPSTIASGWWALRCADPFQDATAAFTNERAYVRKILLRSNKIAFVKVAGSNPLFLVSEIAAANLKGTLADRIVTLKGAGVEEIEKAAGTYSQPFGRVLLTKEALAKLHAEGFQFAENIRIRTCHPDLVCADGFFADQDAVAKGFAAAKGMQDAKHLFTSKVKKFGATIRFHNAEFSEDRTPRTKEETKRINDEILSFIDDFKSDCTLKEKDCKLTCRNGALRVYFLQEFTLETLEKLEADPRVAQVFPDEPIAREKPVLPLLLLKALVPVPPAVIADVCAQQNLTILRSDLLSALVRPSKGVQLADLIGKVFRGMVVEILPPKEPQSDPPPEGAAGV